MLNEIIVSIILVVIPIVWNHLSKKLSKAVEANEILQHTVLLADKNIRELYLDVKDFVLDKFKDGELSEEDKKAILQHAEVEARKRGIELFKTVSPKLYNYLLQMMLKGIL